MPRKQKAAVKSTIAGGVPDRPLVSQPAKTRKSPPPSPGSENATPAAQLTTARMNAAATKSPSGTGPTRTSRARSTPPARNSPQTVTESDRYREAVSRLAYHFWEVRGRPDAGADEDWQRAEWALQEVLEIMSPSST